MKELNLPTNATLECLFCSSTKFEIDSEHPPTSGDMVKCAQCMGMNDYDSMLAVCRESVVDSVKSKLNSYLKNLFKK